MPTDAAAAKRLARYLVRKKLGRGGMGEVYEAVDTRLDRVIAIKLLRPEVVQDEERRARFEREASLAFQPRAQRSLGPL